MNHYNEDTILEFVLELHDEDKMSLIQNHLVKCEICSDKFNKAKEQIGIIGSFNQENIDFNIPLPNRNRHFFTWLKRAAILIFGFITGYAASVLSRPDQINVVEQQLITHIPVTSTVDFIPCQSVDVWIEE